MHLHVHCDIRHLNISHLSYRTHNAHPAVFFPHFLLNLYLLAFLMFPFRIAFVYLLFPAPGSSYTSFDPDCTFPPENTNIVNSPPVRGTFDILWTCLSVLITCTWAIQHLSVPPYDPLEKPSWYNAWKEKTRHTWRKVKWTIFTIATPEFLFAKALAELLAARYSEKQFLKAKAEKPHWKDWSTTHAYYANMRGFILSFQVNAVPKKVVPAERTKDGDQQQLHRGHHDPPYREQGIRETIIREIQHCQDVCGVPCKHKFEGLPKLESVSSPTSPQSTGFQVYLGHTPNLISISSPTTPLSPGGRSFLEDSPTTELLVQPQIIDPPTLSLEDKLGRHPPFPATWALNASQMLYACQQGIIPGPPSITAEQLNERSKGDAFVKIAAVIQIVWLVIQITSRSTSGLATTLLEITVLAFAATAIFTYAFLVTKPQDIRLPEIIEASKTVTREQVIGLAARSSPSTLVVREFWIHGVAIRDQADGIFPYSPGIPIPVLKVERERVYLNRMTGGLPILVPTQSRRSVRYEENIAGLRLYLPKLKVEWGYLNTTIAGIGMAGTVFGSIHCVAWNFAFPTPIEQLLWRVSCLIILIMPLMAAIMYATITHEAREVSQEDNKTNLWLKPLGYALVPVYLLARVYLVVEVFRSLAYLPQSAYMATPWPDWLPHVE